MHSNFKLISQIYYKIYLSIAKTTVTLLFSGKILSFSLQFIWDPYLSEKSKIQANIVFLQESCLYGTSASQISLRRLSVIEAYI